MKKDNKSHIVWLRLSESEYEELKPQDDRSIGNEIRHRLFGEERGCIRRGRPTIGRTEFISFRLSDEEYDAIITHGSEDEPISAIIRELLMSHIMNPDTPYLECERDRVGWKYRRNRLVRVNFSPSEYKLFIDIVKKRSESIASTARTLIFGR